MPPEVTLRRLTRRAITEIHLAVVLATVAAAWALYDMWTHAILHWYADAWVVYPTLIDAEWWQGLTDMQNGHRLVVSQLLRWIDLHAFSGNQQLLRVVGMGWVVSILFVLARAARRAGDCPPWLRAQVLLVLVLGVVWLGNARMLTHPYEAVHVYLVVLLTVLAASILARASGESLAPRHRVVLGLCGVLGPFIFGSGFALLPAMAVVLVLIRARLADYATVGLSAIAAAVLYLGLPGGAGVGGDLKLAPVVQADLLLRWLATPMLYVGLPVVDPDVTRVIQGAPIAAIARPVAEFSLSHFGSVWDMTAPQRLIGVVGVLWLLHASVAAWRGRRPQLAVFGLMLAWVGLGAGALVAVLRTDYFAKQYLIDLHHQLHATRYLPLSCLFWSGLAAASLAQYAASFRPWRIAAAICLLALVLLTSNLGGHVWSAETAQVAADQSAAAREGREPVAWLETEPTAYHRALEPARLHYVGPWADQRVTSKPQQ